MSPFRDRPRALLGPLDVGLASAAERAARALPRAIDERAGGVLRSLAGLERHAYRAFVDPRAMRWLRRILATADRPELARWIPADVRGRAHLLLAREIVAYHGPALVDRGSARREVGDLLVAALQQLDDPSPAHSDLAALAHSREVRVQDPRATARVVV